MNYFKPLFISLIFFFKPFAFSQDLNCKVSVISPTIQMADKRIFTQMQQSIFQFLNNRKWVDAKVNNNERIECNFLIEITSANIDQFKANVQISSSRPIYYSNYKSLLLNQRDEEWEFKYVEGQAMEYMENQNVNNLTALLGFYANIIIGLDFDSYSLEGGTNYFNKALSILNASQSEIGWKPNDGKSNKNKFYLIENILNDRYKIMRKLYYEYHLKNMDMMYTNPEKAREGITNNLESIQELNRLLPNAMFFKVWFNAKQNELIEIFKISTAAEKAKIIELLSKMDPSNKLNYEKIKS